MAAVLDQDCVHVRDHAMQPDRLRSPGRVREDHSQYAADGSIRARVVSTTYGTEHFGEARWHRRCHEHMQSRQSATVRAVDVVVGSKVWSIGAW
jgi:hypothetical protein